MRLVEEIKQTIVTTIPDAKVAVADPNNDGEHFEALVVSAAFDGMPLVRQHQMVMNALKSHFAEKVHALALKTFTPAKWDDQKDKFSSVQF